MSRGEEISVTSDNSASMKKLFMVDISYSLSDQPLPLPPVSIGVLGVARWFILPERSIHGIRMPQQKTPKRVMMARVMGMPKLDLSVIVPV